MSIFRKFLTRLSCRAVAVQRSHSIFEAAHGLVFSPGPILSRTFFSRHQRRRQNQARAILTGALTGAQTGLTGIPQRFLDRLEDNTEPLKLAERKVCWHGLACLSL